MTEGGRPHAKVVTPDMGNLSVQYLCKKDKRLAKVIKMVGPIQYVPHDKDTYSFLIHEIIEQMLAVKAGQKIYDHLEILCGGHVSPEKVSMLTDDEIRAIGTSSSKVKCIRSVTDAVISGDLDFETLDSLSDEGVILSFTKLHGIGKWTAKDVSYVCPWTSRYFTRGGWCFPADIPLGLFIYCISFFLQNIRCRNA